MCKSYEMYWKKSRYESFTPIHQDIVGNLLLLPFGLNDFPKKFHWKQVTGDRFGPLCLVLLSFYLFPSFFPSFSSLLVLLICLSFLLSRFFLLVLSHFYPFFLYLPLFCSVFFPSPLPWTSVQYETKDWIKVWTWIWESGVPWRGSCGKYNQCRNAQWMAVMDPGRFQHALHRAKDGKEWQRSEDFSITLLPYYALLEPIDWEFVVTKSSCKCN